MGSQKEQSEIDEANMASEGEYQYEGEGEYNDGNIMEVNEEGQEQYSDNQNL